MTEDKSRDEGFREMGEAIRRMLEASGNEHRPVIINIRVQVNIAPPEESPREPPGREEDAEIEAPEIEVQKVGGEVKVVTGLPGVSSDDIRVMLGSTQICIQARDGRRVYRSATEIPPPDRNTVRIAFRHGVLEISYRELGADLDEIEEKEG
jgi:HSP20 family molecular chaperone IbpA